MDTLTGQLLEHIKDWNKNAPPMGVPLNIRIKVAANVPLPLAELKAFLNAAYCSTNHLKEERKP